MNTHCKIGRVSFKDSKISALRIENNYDSKWLEASKFFRECWEKTGEVDGFITITWDKNAGFYRCAYLGDAVPLTLMPSWVSEIVRRWISEDCAYDVVSGKI